MTSQRSYSKGFIAPLIAIIIIVALGVGGYVFFQYQRAKNENGVGVPVPIIPEAPWSPPASTTAQNPSPAPAPSPSTSSTIPTDWKTYRNEKYGFEIGYPSALTEYSPNKYEVFKLSYQEPSTLPANSEGAGSTLSIQVTENKNHLTLKQLIEESKKSPSYSIYNPEIYTTIDGYTSFEGRVVNYGIGTLEQIFIIKDNYIFDIHYTNLTSNTHNPIKDVVSTFKFTK